MLTFRNTVQVFVLIIVALMAYDYTHPLSPWYFIIPVIAFLSLIAWGSYFIHSGFFLKAFCDGEESRNQVAITFDDGPHEQTPAILDILNKHKVKASFFCIGKNIPGKEEILKRISGEGHLVGNHSFSHSNFFDFFPLEKLRSDVAQTDELIYRVTGKRNRLFRPPFGVTTPNIARLARERKYHVIGWNLRSFDTTIRDQEKLVKRISTRMRNGSVILLHDTTPGIENILQKIIEHARNKNLEVVSIGELFGIDSYEKE